MASSSRPFHLAFGPRVDRRASDEDAAGTAFLPDRAVDGVDLVARLGGVVRGTLVAVDGDAGWRALDRQHGARRVDAQALRPDGTAVAVRFHVPRIPLPDTDPSCPLVPSFFVYGTLLQGQPRHAAIRRHVPACVLPATRPARLIDLGDYPGMLLADAERPSTVRGELVRFPAATLAAAVARLDAIEDFRGFGVAGSLYVRRLVRVTLADGSAPLAWTYIYAGDARAARPIPSGDWRTRGASR